MEAEGFSVSMDEVFCLDGFRFEHAKDYLLTLEWLSSSSSSDIQTEPSPMQDSSAPLNVESSSDIQGFSSLIKNNNVQQSLTSSNVEDFQLAPCSEKPHAEEEEEVQLPSGCQGATSVSRMESPAENGFPLVFTFDESDCQISVSELLSGGEDCFSTLEWLSSSSSSSSDLQVIPSVMKEDSSAAALNVESSSDIQGFSSPIKNTCVQQSLTSSNVEDFQLVPWSEKPHAEEEEEEEVQLPSGCQGVTFVSRMESSAENGFPMGFTLEESDCQFSVSELLSGGEDCFSTLEWPSSSSSSDLQVIPSVMQEDSPAAALNVESSPDTQVFSSPIKNSYVQQSLPSSNLEDYQLVPYSNKPHAEEEKEEQVQLPPGCYFRPTPKDLLKDYLGNKENGRNLPTNFVKDFDIYSLEPWLLPGADMILAGVKKSLYFFVNLRKTSSQGSRSLRSRPGQQGFWRASTGDKLIKDVTFQQRNVVIGVFKQLTYHTYADTTKPTCKGSKKTEWIMHEYRKEKGSSFTVCKIKRRRQQSNSSTYGLEYSDT